MDEFIHSKNGRVFLRKRFAGIERDFPLVEVSPGVSIAIFNMLGDTVAAEASAKALADKLYGHKGHVLVTPEAKSIPLAHELAKITGLPYVVLRKDLKIYMGEAIKAKTVSITTGRTQTLYLDEKDKALITDKDVFLIDDVISTGSTLNGMRKVVLAAGGRISKIATVFTEGNGDWPEVIALENLPVFTE